MLIQLPGRMHQDFWSENEDEHNRVLPLVLILLLFGYGLSGTSLWGAFVQRDMITPLWAVPLLGITIWGTRRLWQAEWRWKLRRRIRLGAKRWRERREKDHEFREDI